MKHFTAETVVRDGEVIRWDWQGQPRFYLVRIYPHDPRECRQYPHLYTPRVRVHVSVEGDPAGWAHNYCDDDPDAINEVTIGCIGEIESLLDSKWEREAIGELDDRRRVERRSYYR